jgi:hypothetical protein
LLQIFVGEKIDLKKSDESEINNFMEYEWSSASNQPIA